MVESTLRARDGEEAMRALACLIVSSNNPTL